MTPKAPKESGRMKLEQIFENLRARVRARARARNARRRVGEYYFEF